MKFNYQKQKQNRFILFAFSPTAVVKQADNGIKVSAVKLDFATYNWCETEHIM